MATMESKKEFFICYFLECWHDMSINLLLQAIPDVDIKRLTKIILKVFPFTMFYYIFLLIVWFSIY